jgi:hypothetical protein
MKAKRNLFLLVFMARKSSQHSSDAAVELTISAAALQQRWISLSNQLRTEMQFSLSDLMILPEYVANGVTAGFAGRVCEYAERILGGPSPVAPLSRIGHTSLRSWLGFHEMWEQKSGKIFRFHHVSLTVHLGYEGYLPKPQIFRSEWPGIRSWSSAEMGFQSPGAGHPHWQFDAIRTIKDADSAQKERSLAKLREELAVEEFKGAEAADDPISDVKQVALDRIHFASAAPWWLPNADRPYGRHMNAPPDAGALTRWTVQCVAYLRQELARC